MFCIDLEEWDGGGGKEAQEGGDTYVYIWPVQPVQPVQQRLMQHCEAIIFQLKKTSIPTKQLLPLPATSGQPPSYLV